MLDTSHIVYLARAALELPAEDATTASMRLAEMLRAAACWEHARLWTTTMIEKDQIDEQLGGLGLDPLANPDWNEYITTLSINPAAVIPQTGGGPHDDDLLAHVIDAADRYSTLVITNDEDLLDRIQRFALEREGAFAAVNSTSMMLRFLACGAVPKDAVEACLTAEYRNLEIMRCGGMNPTKYERKRHRLENATRSLVLDGLDDEWTLE